MEGRIAYLRGAVNVRIVDQERIGGTDLVEEFVLLIGNERCHSRSRGDVLKELIVGVVNVFPVDVAEDRQLRQ